jgi:hypothetical protein
MFNRRFIVSQSNNLGCVWFKRKRAKMHSFKSWPFGQLEFDTKTHVNVIELKLPRLVANGQARRKLARIVCGTDRGLDCKLVHVGRQRRNCGLERSVLLKVEHVVFNTRLAFRVKGESTHAQGGNELGPYLGSGTLAGVCAEELS